MHVWNTFIDRQEKNWYIFKSICKIAVPSVTVQVFLSYKWTTKHGTLLHRVCFLLKNNWNECIIQQTQNNVTLEVHFNAGLIRIHIGQSTVKYRVHCHIDNPHEVFSNLKHRLHLNYQFREGVILVRKRL